MWIIELSAGTSFLGRPVRHHNSMVMGKLGLCHEVEHVPKAARQQYLPAREYRRTCFSKLPDYQ
jgi:hypothetical protein